MPSPFRESERSDVELAPGPAPVSRALDPRLVRSGFYFVVTLLLVALFKSCEWLIEHFVADSQQLSVPLALAVAVTVGIVFHLFHHRAEHALLAWLNRHARGRAQAVSELTGEVGLIRDRKTLEKRLVERIDQIFGVRGSSLYLLSGEETLGLAAGVEDASLPPEVSCDDPAVIQSMLRRMPVSPRSSGSTLPMPMIWPMLVRGRIVGFIGAACRGGHGFDDIESEAIARLAEAAASAFSLLAGGVAKAVPGSDPRLESRAAPLALPSKPSIAVMPFKNLSGDPQQEHFADGAVEEITTALSRLPWLFVISRNSTFVYKGRTIDARQVGRELGVRYVLDGSVRKEGETLRIIGQLIDATSGTQLWADRIEGPVEHVFEVQDRITRSVLGAIVPKVHEAEVRRVVSRPTDSLDAYECYIRGLSFLYVMTRDGNDSALSAFRRAVQLDARFAPAHARIATAMMYRRVNGWMKDLAAETEEGCESARRAVSLAGEDASVLGIAGLTLGYLGGDLELAERLVERSLSLSSNFPDAWGASSFVNIWMGKPEKGLEDVLNAMRLSPLDPRTYGWQMLAGVACLLAGRYHEACDWAAQSLVLQPEFLGSLRLAAASRAWAGRLDEARTTVGRLIELDPTLRLSNLHMPRFRRESDLYTYVEGLRRAGLPE